MNEKPVNRKELEQKEAIELLNKLLNAGETVYTILRHVSRSGMYRVISTIVIKDNQPRDISFLVSKALGWRFNTKHHGIAVTGCGMDMGFHLVFELSYRLTDYKNGYYLNQKWL